MMINDDERLELINKTRRSVRVGRWLLETWRADMFGYMREWWLLGRDGRGKFEREITSVLLSVYRFQRLFLAADIGVAAGDQDDAHVVAFFALPFVGSTSLSVFFPTGRVSRLLRHLVDGSPHGQRCVGLHLGGDSIYIGLWFGDIFFFIRDLVFGKRAFAPQDITTHAAVISMPEGDYPAEVELVRLPWTRPRGRGRHRSGIDTWGTVTVLGEHGIPVPATNYGSFSDPAEIGIRRLSNVATVEEAVARVREEVVRRRAESVAA